MKEVIRYLVIILVFALLGNFIRDYFFDFSINQIINPNYQIVYRNIVAQIYAHGFVVIAIGIIPLLYLIVSKIAKINFIYKGLIATGIIIGTGLLFWQFRVVQLYFQSRMFSNLNSSIDIVNQVYFEDLNFEKYLLVGFFIGTLISILIFRYLIKKEVQ